MASWDPHQYLAYAGPRALAAVDLLRRIRAERPATVYDLGCGAGNITALLARRWPEAKVVGVDSSPAMLERARAASPGVEFAAADLAAWSPPAPADVLYSNAALHWLGDHARLFAHLAGQLAPGGTLAVQMPRNHRAPSHQLMAEAAAAGPWRARLVGVRGIEPVGEPEFYYRVLAPLVARVDVWETEYLHVLEGAPHRGAPGRSGIRLSDDRSLGENPVVEWTMGSGLRPYLDALAGGERDEFLAAYAERIARAYPREPDGRTLFRFRRIFIVAER